LSDACLFSLAGVLVSAIFVLRQLRLELVFRLKSHLLPRMTELTVDTELLAIFVDTFRSILPTAPILIEVRSGDFLKNTILFKTGLYSLTKYCYKVKRTKDMKIRVTIIVFISFAYQLIMLM
jgi:hypothetical protein